jgi:hypothetical protein
MFMTVIGTWMMLSPPFIITLGLCSRENVVHFILSQTNRTSNLPSPPKKPKGLPTTCEGYKKELARYEGQICWKVLDFKISAKTGEGVWEILDEIYGEL